MLLVPLLGKGMHYLNRLIGTVVTDNHFKLGLAILVIVHVGAGRHDPFSHLLLVVKG